MNGVLSSIVDCVRIVCLVGSAVAGRSRPLPSVLPAHRCRQQVRAFSIGPRLEAMGPYPNCGVEVSPFGIVAMPIGPRVWAHRSLASRRATPAKRSVAAVPPSGGRIGQMAFPGRHGRAWSMCRWQLCRGRARSSRGNCPFEGGVFRLPRPAILQFLLRNRWFVSGRRVGTGSALQFGRGWSPDQPRRSLPVNPDLPRWTWMVGGRV